MPSSLAHSRDFVGRALASLRSGVSEADRKVGREGAESKVEPFDAHNVTTAAGLIKLGTSVEVARRHKANLEAARQDTELSREKTRAEIAKLRAEADYNKGLGRQSARGPGKLTTQVGRYAPGTPLTDVNASMAQDKIDETKRAHNDMNRRTGRVTAANAGLSALEESVKRDTEARATSDLGTWAPIFNKAITGDEASLTRLGINKADWDASYGEQKSNMLAAARAHLHDKFYARNHIAVSQFYEPQRSRYRAIIDRGVDAFGQEDQGGDGDPSNPLGLEDPLGIGAQ